ncbi:MAG: AAA family ATPase [Chloroflexi bacterium]|nr:AAA family ATPase [Chloroflexota bacterium]
MSFTTELAQLEAAIAAQEALRPTLGDAVVDTTLAALRAQLERLRAARPTDSPAAEASPDDLIHRLRSYLPRELAEKMRATGRLEGERKQVTVMFADLSGFTALSETLDPEEVTNLTNEALKELAEAVYQHEGYIDKFVGDAVMAVFGAPVAHEDDPDRALRTALSMRERMGAFNRRWAERLGQSVSLHIGVNTGIVIAGNVGSDMRLSYTVMGDTVNTASRLEGAAQTGQIFVSAETQRLTAEAFAFAELPPLLVKGKREPLTAYELLRARLVPGKARGLKGMARVFVGREAEVAQLRGIAAGLAAGAGHIVLVTGDAGLGKSRLMAEWRDDLQRDGRIRYLEGRCFAHTTSLAFGPLLDLFRRLAGISDEDDEAQARARLEAAVDRLFPDDLEARALFASLLALPPTPEELATLAAAQAEAFRRRLFHLLSETFERLARRQPTVLVLEDMHWADPSSSELVDALLPLASQFPLALVVVARLRPDEFPTRLLRTVGQLFPALFTHLDLSPLPESAIAQMVAQLLAAPEVSPALREAILGKAEGNPFFVEEVIRTLIDRGALLHTEQGWRTTPLMESVSVPDTLQGLLMARLDRLPGETRWVVQQAAVIGRIFLYRVLAEMADRSGGLDSHLEQLRQSEMIRERARLPEVEYIFQHGLTQEVAYQSLLVARRKELHRRVGEAMERAFAGRLGEFQSILAEHFLRGEDWERATDYLLRAADGAARLYALAEARLHYTRALDALARLPDDPPERAALQRRRAEILVRLVSVSFVADSPEQNLARIAEAESLLTANADPAQAAENAVLLARAHYWMGRCHYYSNRPLQAIQYYRQVLAVAEQTGDPELLAIPSATTGRALMGQGRFQQARALLAQALDPLEQVGNLSEWVLTQAYFGGALAALGEVQAGLQAGQRALERARASHNLTGESASQIILGFSYFHGGDYAAMLEAARAAVQVAEQSGDRLYLYFGHGFCAWAQTHLGCARDAIASMNRCDEVGRSMGGRLLIGDWIAAIKAEIARGAGLPVQAAALAERAVAVAREAGGLFAEGMAQHTWALALAAFDPPRLDEAETRLAAGLQALEAGQSRPLAARLHATWAALARARGDVSAAREHLRLALAQLEACGLTNEEARLLAASAR